MFKNRKKYFLKKIKMTIVLLLFLCCLLEFLYIDSLFKNKVKKIEFFIFGWQSIFLLHGGCVGQ
ncbi:hypothetical protein [Aliikangiella maris]|uniref:hypothetical protein n=1 Tax=Aliikangiella maris TaxID=3162458 RepID=UPI003391BC77